MVEGSCSNINKWVMRTWQFLQTHLHMHENAAYKRTESFAVPNWLQKLSLQQVAGVFAGNFAAASPSKGNVTCSNASTKRPEKGI